MDDWYQIDVTNLVSEWLNGEVNYSVMLRGHETYDHLSMMVKLLQPGTGYDPYLSVKYYGPTQ